jgi:hypothetical protein
MLHSLRDRPVVEVSSEFPATSCEPTEILSDKFGCLLLALNGYFGPGFFENQHDFIERQKFSLRKIGHDVIDLKFSC